jgi:hypothetical protein
MSKSKDRNTTNLNVTKCKILKSLKSTSLLERERVHAGEEI